MSANPYLTSEQLWQGNIFGLDAAARDGWHLRAEGKELEALVVEAHAFYTYTTPKSIFDVVPAIFRFTLARSRINEAIRLAQRKNYETLTAEQCETIGTILLRKKAWMRSKPAKADLFFELGLEKPDLMPSTKALLLIGRAEARWEAFRSYASRLVTDALLMEDRLFEEADPVEANRQFTRVLKRAMVLECKAGNAGRAGELYEKARQYARGYDTQDQLRKIEASWHRLTRTWSEPVHA